MLTFKEMEHHDDFDTEVICWVDVSGVPEEFIQEAKEIAGKTYSDDRFGICLLYDKSKKEFAAIEDQPGSTLYYIDENGDKHWLYYQLSEAEIATMAVKIGDIGDNMCSATPAGV